MTTLWDFIETAATRYPDRVALINRRGYRPDQWSYSNLLEFSSRVTAYIRDQGLVHGDRVMIWAPNMPEWVGVFFGCVRAGVIVVPADVQASDDFVQRVSDLTEPKLVFAASQTFQRAESLGPRVALLEDLQSLAHAVEAEGAAPIVEAGDIAEIMFTSGTTGDPKGVILTHGNIVANAAASGKAVPPVSGECLLSILPLSHMFEQTGGMLAPLSGGATIVYPASRKPKVLFAAFEAHGVTTMLVVPQVLELFWQGIERQARAQGKSTSLRRLVKVAAKLPNPVRRLVFRSIHRRLGGKFRLFLTGGAPLNPRLAANWNAIGVTVLQGYGATEASPAISTNTRQTDRPGSVGRVLNGQQVRIADDGEILVAGPNISPGYWNNPAATSEAFVDGWYHTGDTGKMDDDGYLFIRGRKKDVIVLPNGMNVHASDVEAALESHPDVTSACVVGLSDSIGKVRIHAAVVAAESGCESSEVRAHANAGLAAHQRIDEVTLWPFEDLPRTHTLKVKKHEVARYLEGDTSAVVDLPSAPTESTDAADETPAIYELVSKINGVPLDAVSAASSLDADLGLDSLARVELLASIEEEFEAQIPESSIGERTTVADLEALIQSGACNLVEPEYADWPLRRPARIARAGFEEIVAAPIMRVMVPSVVSGRDVLSDLGEPVLFASNHTSHLDTAAIISAMPRRVRSRLTVAAAADYWFAGGRLAAWSGALMFNAFPFSRGGNIRPSLERCGVLLDRGWSVLVYPEGTRSTTGQIGEFKSGVGLLAVELHVPVVPIRVNGLDRVLPKGNKLPRRSHVDVTFGEPMRFTLNTPYADAMCAIHAAVKSLGTTIEHASGAPSTVS